MNASIPVLESRLGNLFFARENLTTPLWDVMGSKIRLVEKNSTLLLFRIEDVGDVDEELPNQIVCYFLLGDKIFIKPFKHSEDFFLKLSPINSVNK